MACNCGNPNCIQCLIEGSTQLSPPPNLDGPEYDAIILVVRPLPPSNKADHEKRQEAMTSIFHHLQTLTLLCSDLNLIAVLNSKKKSS